MIALTLWWLLLPFSWEPELYPHSHSAARQQKPCFAPLSILLCIEKRRSFQLLKLRAQVPATWPALSVGADVTPDLENQSFDAPFRRLVSVALGSLTCPLPPNLMARIS